MKLARLLRPFQASITGVLCLHTPEKLLYPPIIYALSDDLARQIAKHSHPIDESAAVAVDSIRDVIHLAVDFIAPSGGAAMVRGAPLREWRAVLEIAASDLNVIDDLIAIDKDIQDCERSC